MNKCKRDRFHSVLLLAFLTAYGQDFSNIQLTQEPYPRSTANPSLRDSSITFIYPWEIELQRYEDVYIEDQRLDLHIGERPFVTGDTDGDGLLELYGSWLDPTTSTPDHLDSFKTRIYEIGADSLFHLKHTYPERTITSLGLTDIDNDGLVEHYIESNLVENNRVYKPIQAYECSTATSFPTVFQHSYLLPGSQRVNWTTWSDLDNDGQTELLLFDNARDSSATDRMAVIQEYDTTANEYVVRHTFEYPDFISTGFTIGDLDQDGLKEYYISGIHGSVSMVEYSGANDNYSNTWNGSVGTLNAFGSTISPDLDGNGRPELWVMGAALYEDRTATLLTGFEATSDNTLESVATVWLMDNQGGSLPQAECRDMDNDGEMELFLNISSNLLILEHRGDLSFYLGFIMRKPLFGRNSSMHSASAIDIDLDGYPEILANVDLSNGEFSFPQEFVYVYKYNPLSATRENVLPQDFKLFSYPNPFNPSTTIEYELPEYSNVSLIIYDIAGREVQVLVSDSQPAGSYSATWGGLHQDGHQVPAGMYFARLQSGALSSDGVQYSSVVKMVYLR